MNRSDYSRVVQRWVPDRLDLKRRRGAVVLARSEPRSMDRTRVDQLLQQLGHIAAELRSAGMSARQIAAALQRIAQGARL